MNQLDEIDRHILDQLQENGRMNNAELAQRVHLTASPCLRRVKRLEQLGYIDGYRAVLNRSKIGLGLTIFVEIKVVGHGHEGISGELQEKISSLPEVVSLHIVSGQADFLLEVVVADLQSYERFLMDRLLKLPAIKEVRSNFAIRTVKADGPLPLTHLESDCD